MTAHNIVFLFVLAFAAAYFSYSAQRLYRFLRIGRDERRADNPGRRLWNVLSIGIAQRKILVAEPGRRNDVSTALRGIMSEPDTYLGDIVIFLALKTASARLVRDASPEGTKAVLALLWDTALRLEDGNVSMAQRDLRNVQKQLMDALSNNAPDASRPLLQSAIRRQRASW